MQRARDLAKRRHTSLVKGKEREGTPCGDGSVTTYDYNTENHRLKTLETTIKGTTKQKIAYTYDKVGNITERTSEEMGADNRMKKVSHTYTYDDNDRLTKGEGSVKNSSLLRSSVVSYTSSYTYNAIGNILNKNQAVNGGESSLSGNDTYEYGAKQPHAVTKAGSMVFTYDDNGNMVTRTNTSTKNTMTLVWDDENRLIQTKDNFHKTDYRYDASGERIIKKSELGEIQYVSANYIVRNKTVVSAHIFAGNQRIASTVGTMDSCGTVTEQNVLYYHPDHLGSSSYVTDKSGQFYEMIEYLPYGETLYDEQSATSVIYKYTGKEQDSETGLYYYGARYYDAKLGRWCSIDSYFEKYLPTSGDDDLPAGGVYNPINISLYHYSGLNPIRYKDPDGNWFGYDDVATIAVGAICGVAGQYAADKITGKDSSFSSYVGALVGGAVGAETALYAVPICAGLGAAAGNVPGGIVGGIAGGMISGATGGFAGNLAKQFTDKAMDNKSISGKEMLRDTVIGGITGALPGGIGKYGASAATKAFGGTMRGSMSQVAKQMTTKAMNGTAKSITWKTAGKMSVGLTVQGGAFEQSAFSGVMGSLTSGPINMSSRQDATTKIKK